MARTTANRTLDEQEILIKALLTPNSSLLALVEQIDKDTGKKTPDTYKEKLTALKYDNDGLRVGNDTLLDEITALILAEQQSLLKDPTTNPLISVIENIDLTQTKTHKASLEGMGTSAENNDIIANQLIVDAAITDILLYQTNEINSLNLGFTALNDFKADDKYVDETEKRNFPTHFKNISDKVGKNLNKTPSWAVDRQKTIKNANDFYTPLHTKITNQLNDEINTRKTIITGHANNLLFNRLENTKQTELNNLPSDLTGAATLKDQKDIVDADRIKMIAVEKAIRDSQIIDIDLLRDEDALFWKVIGQIDHVNSNTALADRVKLLSTNGKNKNSNISDTEDEIQDIKTHVLEYIKMYIQQRKNVINNNLALKNRLTLNADIQSIERTVPLNVFNSLTDERDSLNNALDETRRLEKLVLDSQQITKNTLQAGELAKIVGEVGKTNDINALNCHDTNYKDITKNETEFTTVLGLIRLEHQKLRNEAKLWPIIQKIDRTNNNTALQTIINNLGSNVLQNQTNLIPVIIAVTAHQTTQQNTLKDKLKVFYPFKDNLNYLSTGENNKLKAYETYLNTTDFTATKTPKTLLEQQTKLDEISTFYELLAQKQATFQKKNQDRKNKIQALDRHLDQNGKKDLNKLALSKTGTLEDIKKDHNELVVLETTIRDEQKKKRDELYGTEYDEVKNLGKFNAIKTINLTATTLLEQRLAAIKDDKLTDDKVEKNDLTTTEVLLLEAEKSIRHVTLLCEAQALKEKLTTLTLDSKYTTYYSKHTQDKIKETLASLENILGGSENKLNEQEEILKRCTEITTYTENTIKEIKKKETTIHEKIDDVEYSKDGLEKTKIQTQKKELFTSQQKQKERWMREKDEADNNIKNLKEKRDEIKTKQLENQEELQNLILGYGHYNFDDIKFNTKGNVTGQIKWKYSISKKACREYINKLPLTDEEKKATIALLVDGRKNEGTQLLLKQLYKYYEILNREPPADEKEILEASKKMFKVLGGYRERAPILHFDLSKIPVLEKLYTSLMEQNECTKQITYYEHRKNDLINPTLVQIDTTINKIAEVENPTADIIAENINIVKIAHLNNLVDENGPYDPNHAKLTATDGTKDYSVTLEYSAHTNSSSIYFEKDKKGDIPKESLEKVSPVLSEAIKSNTIPLIVVSSIHTIDTNPPPFLISGDGTTTSPWVVEVNPKHKKAKLLETILTPMQEGGIDYHTCRLQAHFAGGLRSKTWFQRDESLTLHDLIDWCCKQQKGQDKTFTQSGTLPGVLKII